MTSLGRSGESDPAFVDAVARRVVDLLREEGELQPDGPRLLTAAQVAEKFGVSKDWLYANAGPLGAIRMGSGPRARLRFDRTTIEDRFAQLSSRRRSRPIRVRKTDRGAGGRGGDLLPVRDNPG